MTIIFTLQHKDMLLMASDRRSCESDLSIVPMNEPKIFEGEDLFIGAAGTGDICALVIKAFRKKFKYVPTMDGYEGALESFMAEIMQPVDNNKKVDVSILITFPKVKQTFSISLTGSAIIIEQVTNNYFIGCGSSVARNTFHTLRDTGALKKIKTQKDFAALANTILKQTSKYNAGCGDGGDILIYKKNL